MPTETKYTPGGEPVAVSSPMVPVICKYHGATNTRGAYYSVQRYEMGTRKVGDRIRVPIDHSLNRDTRICAAIKLYLDSKQWEGTWVVATIPNGAIAVWAGVILEESIVTVTL